MRHHSRFIAAALFVCASCQAMPVHATQLWDVASKTQFSASTGYLWFTPTGIGQSNWQGASTGGAITLNLHRRFSVYGAFDHGFPLAESDGHFNIVRAMGSLKLYPLEGAKSDNAIFLGAGRGWFGKTSVKQIKSTEVQVVASHLVNPHVALFGLYSHSFADEPALDFDFLKAGLNFHP